MTFMRFTKMKFLPLFPTETSVFFKNKVKHEKANHILISENNHINFVSSCPIDTAGMPEMPCKEQPPPINPSLQISLVHPHF